MPARQATPPDERLARLHRWCNTGRLAAAELELSDWSREPGAPDGAAALLATIKARRGALSEARDALTAADRNTLTDMSDEAMRVLIGLHTLLGDSAEAATLTRRLHARHGHDRAVSRWLAVCDTPGVESLPAQSATGAARLAEQLRERKELIPTLVFAQRQRPSTGGIDTLRAVLLRLVPVFHDDAATSLMLCRGLASLAQLAGDDDEARRWAHRGLKLDPYNAELALVLGGVADEDAVGEPAVAVLARVNQHHPDYPDVAAALQRRSDIDRSDHERRRAA